MAKWGTYPPDEQLRLKRNAAEELYEALERVWDAYGFDPTVDSSIWQDVQAALAKARGAA